MPNTTDNFDIPFLDGTELVRDYPQFSEDLADAVDAGLSSGFRIVNTLYFTSSGTFTKANFPFLRAIRVKCQGGGGGGGGAAGGSGTAAAAGGGNGGNFAESFITNIASLPASISVVRGAGGAGGAAGNNDGGTGGTSSFSTLVQANGGGSGSGSAANTSPNTILNGNNVNSPAQTTGQITIFGGTGHIGMSGLSGSLNYPGQGGDSVLGHGQRAGSASVVSSGQVGLFHGGGGSGGHTRATTSAPGGAGGNGIVIVELFA